MNTRKIYTAITTAGALAFSLLGAFYFFKPFHAVSESTSTTAKPEALSKAEVEAAYGKLPLSFEANRGQTDGQGAGHGYGCVDLASIHSLILSRRRAPPTQQARTVILRRAPNRR